MGKLFWRWWLTLNMILRPLIERIISLFDKSVVKDVLVQQKLLKTLQSKKLESMTDEEYEELEEWWVLFI